MLAILVSSELLPTISSQSAPIPHNQGLVTLTLQMSGPIWHLTLLLKFKKLSKFNSQTHTKEEEEEDKSLYETIRLNAWILHASLYKWGPLPIYRQVFHTMNLFKLFYNLIVTSIL